MSKTTITEQVLATAIAAGVAQALANLGLTTETPAPPVTTKSSPATEPRFRTAKQIETGRAKQDALWARLVAAEVTRLGRPLKSADRKALSAAHRTELRACWPKGTRKSPVA